MARARATKAFSRACAANLSYAGPCGQQQYARLRFHFPGIPENASGIRMSCAGPRRFFPEFLARLLAIPRTVSGSSENHDSGAARPAGPASSAESCHAVLRDAEAARLPAIPRAQSWRRSDTWLPPAENASTVLYSVAATRGELPEKWQQLRTIRWKRFLLGEAMYHYDARIEI